MKIYKLELNQVADSPAVIAGYYKADRTLKRSEYYLSLARAEKRRDEIYDSTHSLLGFIPKIEVVLTEIDVIEGDL